MQLLFTLFSFVLVLCCLLLGLLILIQLPKKDAGLGQAFGGAATEALFGAGSGSTLSKLTKYCAATFIILCVFLAWMSAYNARMKNEGVLKELNVAEPSGVTAPALPGLLPTETPVPSTPLPTNVTLPVAPEASDAPVSPDIPTPTPTPAPNN